MQARFHDDPAKWSAVERRDASADEQFVFAVKTTGIYCRPSCPARRPKRTNVEFFSSPAQAQHAGYRACRRCTPGEPAVADRHLSAVRAACRRIETAAEPPALAELAAEVGMSAPHFHRVFKGVLGVTPKDYAEAHRLRTLQGRLERGSTVLDAIYDSGYGSTSRVYERSDETLGMTPSKFRGGGEGIEIDFAVTRSELGWLMAATTPKGVCSIEFGEDPQALRSRLQQRFPKAQVREDAAGLGTVLQALGDFIIAPEKGLALPLDIRGTAFQRRVWKALQEIPVGRTASYAEIARAIGKPTAARAVAQACAANKLAVAIPCHRVIRGDGELGGYRWGTERKTRLLEREARTPDKCLTETG